MMNRKKFTLDTLQEFWASRPKGAELQHKTSRYGWNSATACSPRVGSLVDNWRWEPQLKTVDLSPLIGSDVLFEFGIVIGKKTYESLGFLKDIVQGEFIDHNGSCWEQCKPVMERWMAVNDSLVLPAGLDHRCEITIAPDIKMATIYGLKDGYHWPWEE